MPLISSIQVSALLKRDCSSGPRQAAASLTRTSHGCQPLSCPGSFGHVVLRTHNARPTRRGPSLFAGLDHWTGLLDWTTGLGIFHSTVHAQYACNFVSRSHQVTALRLRQTQSHVSLNITKNATSCPWVYLHAQAEFNL